MYISITKQIKTILEGVDKIAKVYSYPESDLEEYPAVVFYPVSTENDWETVNQNKRTYRYKIWVIVEKTSGADEEKIFGVILPKVTDEIEQALDENWSLTGDNRTWLKFDTGVWSLQKPKDGPVTATAEIDLSIRTLLDN